MIFLLYISFECLILTDPGLIMRLLLFQKQKTCMKSKKEQGTTLRSKKEMA
jgi:hypothetical protein